MSKPYRIFETDVFQEDLEGAPNGIRDKLKLKIQNHAYSALKNQPYFGKNIKKLTGFRPPTWRYRLGDYRIFYTIDDQKRIISVLTISNRKDAY